METSESRLDPKSLERQKGGYMLEKIDVEDGS